MAEWIFFTTISWLVFTMEGFFFFLLKGNWSIAHKSQMPLIVAVFCNMSLRTPLIDKMKGQMCFAEHCAPLQRKPCVLCMDRSEGTQRSERPFCFSNWWGGLSTQTLLIKTSDILKVFKNAPKSGCPKLEKHGCFILTTAPHLSMFNIASRPY